MPETTNVFENHKDGSLYRRLICECGNSVYKKNLKTGVIEFLARTGGKQVEPIPLDGVSQTKVFCEKCGSGHIVLGVQEGLGISDEPSLHTDIAK